MITPSDPMHVEKLLEEMDEGARKDVEQMEPVAMKDFFIGMQKELYNGKGVVNVTVENHFDGEIQNLTING